jgi:hypothetical protein
MLQLLLHLIKAAYSVHVLKSVTCGAAQSKWRQVQKLYNSMRAKVHAVA